MNSSIEHPYFAVVLTALALECKAVLRHLGKVKECQHPQGTIYQVGEFAADTETIWNVAVAVIGAGNANAAFEAERAISFFHPKVVLFVGVAGGLKDVAIGDVVAARVIYGYESGKVVGAQAGLSDQSASNTTTDYFLPRASVGNSTYRMEQRALIESMSEEWMLRLPQPVPDSKPRVFVEPIAAGEKVIAETRSAVYNFLRSQYSAAVAVEMEGRGFLTATRANNVDALVIRGISDLIDSKSNADAQGSQDLAATRASAFAFQVLSKLDIGNDRSSDAPLGEGTALNGDVESQRATYFRIIDRQFLGNDKQKLADVLLREPETSTHATRSLLDVMQHYRHFSLLTHDPISTCALLMAATRYAVGQNILNTEIIPLRLPLERWLTGESLDDLLTIALSDITCFSSNFIAFLHRQIEAGQAFLLLEPPAVGELPSEAIGWIRDLTRGVAHNSRLVVLAKFGHNILDLRKIGFPILVQPYSESELPNLSLMLRALANETRDPSEDISGELQISCKVGRPWSIALKSSDNCYLAIFCRGTTGKLYRLFLDSDQAESFIYSKHIYTVPRRGEEFYLTEQGPPGNELIHAFATREPLSAHFALGTGKGYLYPSSEADFTSIHREFQQVPEEHRAYAECQIIVED